MPKPEKYGLYKAALYERKIMLAYAYAQAMVKYLQLGNTEFPFAEEVEQRKDRFKSLEEGQIEFIFTRLCYEFRIDPIERREMLGSLLDGLSAKSAAELIARVAWIKSGRLIGKRENGCEVPLIDSQVLKNVYCFVLERMCMGMEEAPMNVLVVSPQQLRERAIQMADALLASWGRQMMDPDQIRLVGQGMDGMTDEQRRVFLTELMNAVIKHPPAHPFEFSALIRSLAKSERRSSSAN